jgi:GMP synthase (glutamine-hydrolysing)
MEKTAVVIRHVPFEDLGAFSPVLERIGFQVRYIDAGSEEMKGAVARDADLLFVLGGPIGANDEGIYPFLVDELQIIEDRLKNSKPIVGICLGAQLMARSLGAKVYPGRSKEIGFAPIQLTEAGQLSCLRFFNGVPLLHWHGDTFDLPSKATLLASTEACLNQAFSYESNAIAFQFHPEAVGANFETWLIAHTFELSANQIDIPTLRREWQQRSAELSQIAGLCIEEWVMKVVRSSHREA